VTNINDEQHLFFLVRLILFRLICVGLWKEYSFIKSRFHDKKHRGDKYDRNRIALDLSKTSRHDNLVHNILRYNVPLGFQATKNYMSMGAI